MNSAELGIVDTRNVIRLVNEMYQYDFSDHALTSFKRGLERILTNLNLKYADALLARLREDPSFIDSFLHSILVEPTEMFRDPSLWRLIRDEYLPKIASEANPVKVWFPYISSPEELLTLSIVLKECGLQERFTFMVSCLSNQSIEFIRRGTIRLSKFEVSEDNYTRYHGKGKLSDYCHVSERFVTFDAALLEGINYATQNLNFDNITRGSDLIFFRNQLLYFNQTLQDKVINAMTDSLAFGGYLVLGTREKIQFPDNRKILRTVNEDENIYQKR